MIFSSTIRFIKPHSLITTHHFPPTETPMPTPMCKWCPPVKWKNQGYILCSPNVFMLFCTDFVWQNHIPGSIETKYGLLSKIIGVFALIQLLISYLIIYLPQANVGSSSFLVRNVPGKWKPFFFSDNLSHLLIVFTSMKGCISRTKHTTTLHTPAFFKECGADVWTISKDLRGKEDTRRPTGA